MRGASHIPPGEQWMDSAGNFRGSEGPGRNEERRKRHVLKPACLLRVLWRRGKGEGCVCCQRTLPAAELVPLHHLPLSMGGS